MTRDDATRTLMKYQGDHDPERAGNLIDALNALGILKLDEPKSIVERQLDAACSYNGWYGDPEFGPIDRINPEYLRWVLNKFGLKVVEK